MANTDLEWRAAKDGRLGVFTTKSFALDDLVERCYCLPLKPSAIPGEQIKPALFDRGGAEDSDQPLLFPLGWGLLYNEVGVKDASPNLAWDYQAVEDSNGELRDYVLLTAVVAIEAGSELIVARKKDCLKAYRLRDVLGSAIEHLKAVSEFKLPADVSALSSTVDLPEAVLNSSTLQNIEIRSSPLHANGVYALTQFKKGDIIEFAPNLLVNRWEIGDCLADYRFAAFDAALDNSVVKVALALGSVFNHSDEPNVGYRKATTCSSSLAAQKFMTCYYANRDIEEGEELFISYGPDWWKSRAKDTVSLAEWRTKRGETKEGRPFYDHPDCSRWCVALNVKEKSTERLNPAVLEAMHRAFVDAEDGNLAKLCAWRMVCDAFKESAGVLGAINTPLRESGERATHRQAELGHVQNLKWLAQNGADVNAATAPSLDMSPAGDASSFACPAHVAAINGRIGALTVLQGAGADLNCKRPDGATPFDFAEDDEQTEAAAWLARRGGISGIA